MKTKLQAVTGNVSIWAVPRYTVEEGSSPFEYKFYTNDDKPWRDGAVNVITHEITLDVPEGVDLIAKAVETLEAAKAKVYETYLRETRELDQQIEKFVLLSYDGPAEEKQEFVKKDFPDY